MYSDTYVYGRGESDFIVFFFFFKSCFLSTVLRFRLPIIFQKHAKGQDLFDQIVYHLDLVETDYFGLQFLDSAQVPVSIPLIPYTMDWLITGPRLLEIGRERQE